MNLITTSGSLLKVVTVLVLLVTLSFLNISGCGSSGGSTAIGPEGGTVTTSDGRCTLEIPAGALSEDVDISITRDDSFEGDFLVYDAQPDGLEFSIPATLLCDVSDIATDEEQETKIMIGFNVSGDEVEQLGDQEYDINFEDGISTYSSEVNHFSQITLFNGVVVIENSIVPGTGTANSFLTNFNVSVKNDFIPNPSPMAEIGEDEFSARINRVEYRDASSGMVIYNGVPVPFDMEDSDPSQNFNYTTGQPYNCGEPGNGNFIVSLLVEGETVTFDGLGIEDLFFANLNERPFSVVIPGTRNVQCVASTGDDDDDDIVEPPMPPPPPGDDDDDDDVEPPMPPPSTPEVCLEEGSYSFGGNCGLNSGSLSVAENGVDIIFNTFGANSNTLFTATQFDTDGNPTSWSSQSNNLNILGAPGHSCSISKNSETSFTGSCTNSGGGLCNFTGSKN